MVFYFITDSVLMLLLSSSLLCELIFCSCHFHIYSLVILLLLQLMHSYWISGLLFLLWMEYLCVWNFQNGVGFVLIVTIVFLLVLILLAKMMRHLYQLFFFYPFQFIIFCILFYCFLYRGYLYSIFVGDMIPVPWWNWSYGSIDYNVQLFW